MNEEKKLEKNTKQKYFGESVHDSVCQYQKSSPEDRKIIYEREIRPAFEKLVENLVFIHNSSATADNISVIKSDCVSFLYETLNKFSPEKGTKAFSYFNVCAKNYLIAKNRKSQKNERKFISLEDLTSSNRGSPGRDHELVDNYKLKDPERERIQKEDQSSFRKYLHDSYNKEKNENDKKCLEAIIMIFENIEEIDIVNKRAVFHYMREISGLNPKQLSISLTNVRKKYRDISRRNGGFFS